MQISFNDIPSCNLCSCLESKVLFQPQQRPIAGKTDFFRATTDKYGVFDTIRQCIKCGHIFSTPRFNPNEILTQYRENIDMEYMEESDSRSINAYLSLARIRQFAPRGRLLEVGCGTGYFLNAARLSYEVTGVEPSTWASHYAKEKLNLNIAAATLEEAKFSTGYFDIVVLIDVIEHMPDPSGMLREINRISKTNAIIYLVTPDIKSITARLMGRKWWGLRPAHIHYFSLKSLSELFSRCGFSVLCSRSYGRIFTYQYWLTRLSSYPRFVFRPIEKFIRAMGIEDKFLYIDTRDSIQVIGQKR